MDRLRMFESLQLSGCTDRAIIFPASLLRGASHVALIFSTFWLLSTCAFGHCL